MRKSGLSEKYVRVVLDIYEDSEIVMRVVGVIDGFKVWVGLHQGSTVSPFFSAVEMVRLTD